MDKLCNGKLFFQSDGFSYLEIVVPFILGLGVIGLGRLENLELFLPVATSARLHLVAGVARTPGLAILGPAGKKKERLRVGGDIFVYQEELAHDDFAWLILNDLVSTNVDTTLCKKEQACKTNPKILGSFESI